MTAIADRDELTSKRDQVIAQCRAVAHMATEIAKVHTDYAAIFSPDNPAADNILDITGNRTAASMERLGDMLNGMDAATDDDKWMTPIFQEAQRRWPQGEPA
jgi:hypothetical protein